MKAVQAYAQKNEQALISAMEKRGRYEIKVGDEAIVLENEDVDIIPVDIPGWKVANSGPVTVALDITITEPLRQEGMARELVNRIQNIRKDKGFEVTDKINVQIAHHDKLDAAIKNNLTYICSETLTKNLNIVERITDKQALAVEVDEEVSTVISVEKI